MPPTSIDRRGFLGRCALVAAGTAAASSGGRAFAQTWPGRPVRIVYPYQGGGVGDAMVHFMEPALEQRFKQAFFLETRPGAGGNIGTSEVVRAAPDGHTFVMGATANYAVNQYLYKLGYDPLTQLEPVVAVADAPLLAVVGPNVTATSLRQLAEQIRAPGARFNYGSPGAGSPTHLAGASFGLMLNSSMEHISFKGVAPMAQSMLSGDVQLAFPTLTVVSGHLKTGKLRALAVLSRQRLPDLPDVPTAAEAGFPELLFGNWWVLAAPRGTPSAIVQSLGDEVRQILRDPAIRARIGEMGHVPLGYDAAETASFVRGEAAKYRTLIERTGIRIE